MIKETLLDILFLVVVATLAAIIFSIPTVIMTVNDNMQVPSGYQYERFQLPEGHPNKP